jgi:hypothetical protein
MYVHQFLGASISDKVTGGGGSGGAILGKSRKFRVVKPEAQKVSGHLEEGQRKPRLVPGKSLAIVEDNLEIMEDGRNGGI